MRFWLLIPALLLVCLGIGVPRGHAAAAQSGCPAYSHPAYETDNVVHCKCNEGLISYDGRCQNKAAIEDRLQLRVVNILEGIRSTNETIEAERTLLIADTLKNHFKRIDLTIGGVLLARNKALAGTLAATAFSAEALDIAVDLGSALGEWGECAGTSNLQVACNNLHNFQKLLRETASDLSAVEQK